jgi:hypothetical protein
MRIVTANLTLGLLVTGILALGNSVIGCSSSSEDAPITPGPQGGSMNTGGMTAGGTGGTAAGAGGTTGGEGGAGGAAAGAGGAAGAAGSCGIRAIRDPDTQMCRCQPQTLTMCSDGCHDPMKDPDHCGQCEMACGETSACELGACTPAPTEVVAAVAGCGGISLAVAGGTLYWASMMTGTIQSQAAGGTPTMVATGQMGPKSLQVHGDALFWMNTGTNEVMSVPLTGGTPAAIVTTAMIMDTTNGLGGYTVSADGLTLYFADGVTIYSMPVAGGAATEVGHEDSGIPKALAVEGDLIAFPADVNGDVDVMTIVEGTPAVCASDDSTTAVNLNCARIARSQGALNLEAIFLVDGNAYWGNQSAFQTSSAAMPTGFNEVVANGSPDSSKLTSFTVFGTTSYFADDEGNVFSAPLMINATPKKLGRAQMGITSFAADATTVYWANEDCSIQSMPASAP